MHFKIKKKGQFPLYCISTPPCADMADAPPSRPSGWPLLRQHVLDFLQRNTEKADANYECLRNEIENVDSEADDMPLPDTEPMNADPSSPCARRTTLTQQLETAYKWALRRITPDLSRQDRSQQDTEAMITSFLRLRPDGVALNLSQHKERILEFTRSMDALPSETGDPA